MRLQQQAFILLVHSWLAAAGAPGPALPGLSLNPYFVFSCGHLGYFLSLSRVPHTYLLTPGAEHEARTRHKEWGLEGPCRCRLLGPGALALGSPQPHALKAESYRARFNKLLGMVLNYSNWDREIWCKTCCLSTSEDSLGVFGVENVSEWRLSRAFANCPAAPVEARCLALPFLVCIFPCPAARNAWLHHAEEGKLNFKAVSFICFCMKICFMLDMDGKLAHHNTSWFRNRRRTM